MDTPRLTKCRHISGTGQPNPRSRDQSPDEGGEPHGGSGRPADVVSIWQSRIRRGLLVAHAAPAIAGFLVVTLVPGLESVRPIDRATWLVVCAWTLYLMVGGWNRLTDDRSIIGWVMADAAVMAALMLVGTPARQIVIYVAVDGALFAAVFLSIRLALLHLGVTYSGLFAAALLRQWGSDVPSPITGWLLPLAVSLAGVGALGFMGAAIRRLHEVAEKREEAMARTRALQLDASSTEALTSTVSAIEAAVAPGIDRLTRLSRLLLRAANEHPAAREEATWLSRCVAEMTNDLTGLRSAAVVVDRSIDEVVEAAVVSASVARLIEAEVSTHTDPRLQGLAIGGWEGALIEGFVREAVTNAIVHGRSPVRVRVEAEPDRRGVVVLITDAGKGFDPESVDRGIGLADLERYVSTAGGRLIHRVGPDGHTVGMAVALGEAVALS